jgi:hypothetical protein
MVLWHESDNDMKMTLIQLSLLYQMNSPLFQNHSTHIEAPVEQETPLLSLMVSQPPEDDFATTTDKNMRETSQTVRSAKRNSENLTKHIKQSTMKRKTGHSEQKTIIWKQLYVSKACKSCKAAHAG